METGPACGACGIPLARGLCPRCLLDVGLSPEPGAAPAPPDTTPSLARLGDYELLEEIGRGGMGIVYRARQVSLDRTVAVKLLPFGGLGGADAAMRLRAEAVAAGSLRHPHIVAVHEVGLHQGQHFLAMDYVAGPSLARMLRDGPLPARRAATLLRQIALAMQHAHERGIIHRDLKPSNILLDAADDEPRVTDFGLAKNLHSDTQLTLSGQTLGSPNYIPPEQVRGGRGNEVLPNAECGVRNAEPASQSLVTSAATGGKISFASDVYALGAVLYHTLTGRPPFQGENIADVLRQVLDDEPLAPRRLTPSIPADLETICLKCLEKEPARRYVTAQAFADDLGRYLDGEPVLARPVTRAERVVRWCRRKPALAGFVAATLVLLIAVAVGSPIAAWRINHERLRAEKGEHDAREQLWTSWVAQARSGRLSGRDGRRFDSLDVVAKATAIRPTVELRNEAIACLALTDLRVQTQWPQPGLTFFDADLEHYALGDEKGNVSVREVATRREVVSLPGMGVSLGADLHDAYHALLFSPDNEFLAIRNRNGAVQVWRWRQQRLIFPTVDRLAVRVGADGPTNVATFGVSARMQFTPDSRSLAVMQADGVMRVFGLATGEEQRRFVLENPPFNFLRFSPSGDKFCLVHKDEHVQLHRASDGQLLKTFPIETGGFFAAWHPDGKRLATGGYDQKIHLWDVETGKELTSLSGHQSMVSYVAFSHDGKLLVPSSWDTTTRVWDADSGKELLNLRTGGYCPRFSRDDRRFVRSNPVTDDLPEVYEVALGSELRTLVMTQESETTWGLHFSPDGRLLASAHHKLIALWDSASARQLATFPAGEGGAVRFSGDGRTLFAAGPAGLERRAIRLQPGPTFDTIYVGPPETIGARVTAVTTSVTDDDRTMVVSDDKGARVLNLDDPVIHEVLLPTQQKIAISAAISPEGNWIAIGGYGALEIWDARSNVFQCAFPEPMRQFVVFSPDGKWLVSGCGREYQIREVGTWNVHQRLAHHPNSDLLRPMAFSPDGQMLAIGLTHDTVQLLDTTTWRELATLESPHPTILWSLCFSPDGAKLAVGSLPRQNQLWDLRLIRRRLAAMNLDWELPPYPTEDRLQQIRPLRVIVDGVPPPTN